MRIDSSVIRALGELGLLIDRINSMGIARAGKIRYSQNPRLAGLGKDLWRSKPCCRCELQTLRCCELGSVCGRIDPVSVLVHNYSRFVLCRDSEVDPLDSNYFYFLNFSPS